MSEELRAEARQWLETQLSGRFAALRGINNFVDEIPLRRDWERALGGAGLSVIAWPREHGGRAADIAAQLAFAEEYARAGAPSRIGHLGVELIGPTILAYGSDEQKARLLPPIARGEAIWCQGYSEPNAGSDLANVRTRATRGDGRWVVDGQKVWTSLGPVSDWIFVVARSQGGSKGPKGLSFLVMPLDQPGITVRPIRQMTGESEFAEVFFDGAVTGEEDLIGAEGDGWAVAMALLGFERGVSTIVQQMQFSNELDQLIAAARSRGRARDPLIRQRLADAWTGLQVMRFNALRMMAGGSAELGDAALTSKLFWSRWHRDLGDLAMDVLGPAAQVGGDGYRFATLPHMHLMSRADTIYAGSSQIQRNLIAERALGLPREPRGDG